MKFRPTRIPDVVLVEPERFGDHRGFFMETYREHAFREAGIAARFVQDNHSRSLRNTLRGLHYQVERAQGKLVRAVRGEIFDVAVDLRRSSPWFGQWVGERLSEENGWQLWVPPGFAHGFLVLSESADCVYKCTDYYAPEHERQLRWDDGQLAIEWPLAAGQEPILSARDAAGLPFAEAECYP